MENEVLEAHEHAEHGGHPLTMPVTVTLAILAVLIAVATLLAQRSSKEELLLQTQETDQWAFFQAKNSGMHGMQNGADILGVLTPVDKDKAAELREKYLKEAERYKDEKAEAQKEAEKLKDERQIVARRGDRFEAGEVFLEIGLILSSLTLLTKNRLFWMAGIVSAIVGVGVAISGFLLH